MSMLIEGESHHSLPEIVRLIEESLAAIFVIHGETFVYASPKMADIFGYAPTEIVGLTIGDIAAESERLLLIGYINKLLKWETSTLSHSFIGVKKDGSSVHIDIEGAITGYRGKPAVTGHLRDSTEQKRIKSELEQAKEKAEDENEIKDKYLSLVFHDIRSPLSSMIGLLHLLEKERDSIGELNNKQKNIVCRLIKSGYRIMDMVEDLLEIRRLKSGKVTLTMNPLFDVKGVAEAVIDGLSDQAGEKGILIDNNIDSGTKLFADYYLIGVVLRNLVSNAIKFTSNSGRIELFIPGGHPTTVAVKDNGIGICPGLLPDLFKHEIKTSTIGTAGEKGTGLGLPFCRDIMEAHGGALRVESTEGKGSIFYAEFPIYSAHLSGECPSNCKGCSLAADSANLE